MTLRFQPPPPPALPLEQSEYHSFWRTARWSWWRPVVAMVVFGVAFFGFALLAIVASLLIDGSTGRTSPEDFLQRASEGIIEVTPALFLANNLALAALIPTALLLGWALFRQRPRWLSSVTGGIRWGWLARCAMVIVPLWLVYLGAEYLMAWQFDEEFSLSVNPDTWLLVIGILVTTPLQAAGEEYGFRGFIQRSVSSFFRSSRIGLAVGALVASSLFMLAHGAGDMWLNVFYFSFAMVATWMTWRTGGLEAAIVMHVTNNVLSEATMPFQDISGMFNREAGTAGWPVLIGVAVCVGAALLVDWQARRTGVVRSNDPGARTQEGKWFLAARQPWVVPQERHPEVLGPEQQFAAGASDPNRIEQWPPPREWDERQD